MDRDSIREFLAKRLEEDKSAEFLPSIKPKYVEPEGNPVKLKKKKTKLKLILRVAALCLIVFVLIFGGFRTFEHFQNIEANKSQNIIANVSKLTDIPSDEKPTIATVTNPTSLKDQYFFQDAQVGDKILFFSTAKKAILYRPSTNKIISIAPLN